MFKTLTTKWENEVAAARAEERTRAGDKRSDASTGKKVQKLTKQSSAISASAIGWMFKNIASIGGNLGSDIPVRRFLRWFSDCPWIGDPTADDRIELLDPQNSDIANKKPTYWIYFKSGVTVDDIPVCFKDIVENSPDSNKDTKHARNDMHLVGRRLQNNPLVETLIRLYGFNFGDERYQDVTRVRKHIPQSQVAEFDAAIADTETTTTVAVPSAEPEVTATVAASPEEIDIGDGTIADTIDALGDLNADVPIIDDDE